MDTLKALSNAFPIKATKFTLAKTGIRTVTIPLRSLIDGNPIGSILWSLATDLEKRGATEVMVIAQEMIRVEEFNGWTSNEIAQAFPDESCIVRKLQHALDQAVDIAKENIDLPNRLSDFEWENKELKEKIERLDASIEKMEKSIEQNEKDLKEREKEMDAVSNENKVLSGEKKHLEDSLKEMEDECDEKDAKIEGLSEELKQSLIRNAALQRELDLMQRSAEP